MSQATPSLPSRTLQNFTLRHEGEQISCYGKSEDLDNLEEKIAAGFVQRETSGDQLQCLLYALEISLRALHVEDGKQSPSFKELREYLDSEAYSTLRNEHIRGLDPETQAEFSEEENYFSNMALILLALVGDILGEIYQLAHIDDQTTDRKDPRFFVYAHGDLKQRQVTKTVWVFREPWSGDISHWSGLAPKPSTPPETSSKEATKDPPGTIRPRIYLDKKMMLDAPEATTNLPYELIQGITGNELIFFFPHHVLQWPAIGARIWADGYKAGEVLGLMLLRARNNTTDNQKSNLSSSVRNNINVGEAKFLQNTGQLEEDTKTKKHGIASKQSLESEGWTKHVPKKEELEPPWTLEQLARNFMNLEKDLKLKGAPTRGPFTNKILAEKTRILKNLPITQTNPSAGHSDFSDPPSLPKDWIHGDEARVERGANGVLLPIIGEQSARLKHKASARQDWKEILNKTQRNVDTIIEKYAETLEGEFHLWMLSKDGGRIAKTQYYEKIKKLGKKMNSSTLSKRTSAALEQRAVLRGTTKKEEQRKFRELEQYNPPAGTKAPRKPSASRTRKSTSSQTRTKRRKTMPHAESLEGVFDVGKEITPDTRNTGTEQTLELEIQPTSTEGAKTQDQETAQEPIKKSGDAQSQPIAEPNNQSISEREPGHRQVRHPSTQEPAIILPPPQSIYPVGVGPTLESFRLTPGPSATLPPSRTIYSNVGPTVGGYNLRPRPEQPPQTPRQPAVEQREISPGYVRQREEFATTGHFPLHHSWNTQPMPSYDTATIGTTAAHRPSPSTSRTLPPFSSLLLPRPQDRGERTSLPGSGPAQPATDVPIRERTTSAERGEGEDPAPDTDMGDNDGVNNKNG